MRLAECVQNAIYNGILADPYCRTHFFVFKLDDFDVMITKYAHLDDDVTKKRITIKFKKYDLEPHQHLSPCESGPTIDVRYFKSGIITVSDNLVNQDDYPTAEYNIANPAFRVEDIIENALLRCKYMLRGYTDPC